MDKIKDQINDAHVAVQLRKQPNTGAAGQDTQRFDECNTNNPM